VTLLLVVVGCLLITLHDPYLENVLTKKHCKIITQKSQVKAKKAQYKKKKK